MERIKSGRVLLFGFAVISAVTDLQCPTEVEVSPGGNATLPFLITLQIDRCEDWTFELMQADSSVWVFREGKEDVHSRHEKFKDIVFPENPCSGNFSVQLKGVDATHSGPYTLFVTNGHEDIKCSIKCSINLTVREQVTSTPPTSTPPTQPDGNETPDKQGSLPTGDIIGGIIGGIVITGFIIVGVIVIVMLIYPKCKKKPQIHQVTEEEMKNLRGNEEPNTPAGR